MNINVIDESFFKNPKFRLQESLVFFHLLANSASSSILNRWDMCLFEFLRIRT